MPENLEMQELTFKKGDVIYRQGDLNMQMYDILWGHVALYVDYGLPTQLLLNEADADGFIGIVGFLESRMQNTTAVATEETVVGVISRENFGRYFQARPAKIMSIMQYMSARMRALTKAYIAASQTLEEYADTDRLKAERKDWYEEHTGFYHRVAHLFGMDQHE